MNRQTTLRIRALVICAMILVAFHSAALGQYTARDKAAKIDVWIKLRKRDAQSGQLIIRKKHA